MGSKYTRMIFQMLNDNPHPRNYEMELLLCCSRTHLNDKIQAEISNLVEKDINWIYFIQEALSHDILPLVYRNLNLDNYIDSDVIVDYLKEQYEKQVGINLLLTGELLKLIRLFNEENIFFVPYKGPVLAAAVYGNLSFRTIKDIEIFIQKEDNKKIKDLMQSLEYEYMLNEKIEDIYQKHYNQYIFKSKKRANIKIQWKISKLDLSYHNKESLSLDEPVKIDFNNYKILSFTSEDLILISSLNSTYSYKLKLKYLCDVNEIINNMEINWDHLLEKAEKLGLKRILLVSLSLARDLLQLELPPKILNEINTDESKIREISFDFKKRLFLREAFKYTIFKENNLQFKMRENISDGLKTVLKSWIIPSYDELKNVSLFSNLNLAYYLYRPYHLLKDYIKLYKKTKTIFINYVPSPEIVVSEMLKIANLGPHDIIYDLGCGDGRIIINAAKKYSARGLGIDIDSERISESKKNAIYEGVEDLTDFIKMDLLKADLSQANVITFWLWPDFMPHLSSKFKKELSPNTRIISCNYTLTDWKPTKSKILEHGDTISAIYLYKV